MLNLLPALLAQRSWSVSWPRLHAWVHHSCDAGGLPRLATARAFSGRPSSAGMAAASNAAAAFRADHFEPTAVLVTGGCGFIGPWIVRRVREQWPTVPLLVLDKMDYCSSVRDAACRAIALCPLPYARRVGEHLCGCRRTSTWHERWGCRQSAPAGAAGATVGVIRRAVAVVVAKPRPRRCAQRCRWSATFG